MRPREHTMDVRELLLVYPTAAEGGRVAKSTGAVEVGAGKAACAASVTRAVIERRPRAVLLFGVCGAFPAEHLREDLRERALDVLDLCAVESDGFADEGVVTADGFISSERLGFFGPERFPGDPRLLAWLARALPDLRAVRAATASTGSGTDEASREIARRTGALVETMEGAAAAQACALAGVPFAQLRCVSNRTGDRARGGFDLRGACERVQDAVLRALRTPLRET